MLDSGGELDPAVLARLPNRDPWGREVWIAKGAGWNGDEFWHRAQDVVDGGPALGAEVICARVALIGDADVLGRVAPDANPLTREAGVEPKRASGPALAGDAVADRNPGRFSFCDQLDLTATAAGLTLDDLHTVEA